MVENPVGKNKLEDVAQEISLGGIPAGVLVDITLVEDWLVEEMRDTLWLARARAGGWSDTQLVCYMRNGWLTPLMGDNIGDRMGLRIALERAVLNSVDWVAVLRHMRLEQTLINEGVLCGE